MTRTEPTPDSQSDPGRPGWRDAVQSDPLGLVHHREWEEPAGPPTNQEPNDPRGVLRLLLMVAAVLALGYLGGVGETVLLVLVLILCVVAHEFGHYLAAKTGRVKVTEFFVGFGPRLWSIRKGETEYGVKGIPAGGYCRIIGMNNLEEVDPEDETRTYRHAPLWRRLLIDVAGPGMNFLIAFVVLFGMFFWTGDNGNYLANIPADNPIAETLAFTNGPSPAQQAGIKPGDRIEAIDGRHFASWTAMGKFIQAHPGQKLELTVDRGGRTILLSATPAAADAVHVKGDSSLPSGKAGFLGIAVDPVIHSGFVASVEHSGSAMWFVVDNTGKAFGRLFTLHGASTYVHMLGSQQAANSSSADQIRFSSPVRVVQIFHQAAADGISTVLWVIGVINVSLGLFNLIPLFPLDGGRVIVGLYEGLRSRRRPYRVDMNKLLPVLYGGLALIAFIALTSLFLDLRGLVT